MRVSSKRDAVKIVLSQERKFVGEQRLFNLRLRTVIALVGMVTMAYGCDEHNQGAVNLVTHEAAVSTLDNEAPVAPNNDEASRSSNVPAPGKLPVEQAVFGGDDPQPVITAIWVEQEEAKRKKVETNALELVITNHLSIPSKVTVSVDFTGILEETATVEMAPIALAAEDETIIEIPHGDIPMQTTRGVCQAVASITADYDDGERQWRQRASTHGLFYRSLPEYSGIMVFGEQIFIDQFKGQFSGVSDVIATQGIEAASKVVLGRIKRSTGDFEEITIPTDKSNASLVVGTTMGYGEVLETEASNAQ